MAAPREPDPHPAAPPARPAASRVPYPQSLCHTCDAPPRYVRTARSVFILCPILPTTKYPPQPVIVCPSFAPRPLGSWVPLEGENADADAGSGSGSGPNASTSPKTGSPEV